MNRTLREATRDEVDAWRDHQQSNTDETYQRWLASVRRRNGLRETGEADATPSALLLALVGLGIAALAALVVMAVRS